MPFGIYPKCAVQNIWLECWWVSTVQTFFFICNMFLCQDVHFLILSPIICKSRVSHSLVCVFRSLKKCRIKSLLLFCRMSLNSHWHCCLSLKRSRWEAHTYSSGIRNLGLIRHASHTHTHTHTHYHVKVIWGGATTVFRNRKHSYIKKRLWQYNDFHLQRFFWCGTGFTPHVFFSLCRGTSPCLSTVWLCWGLWVRGAGPPLLGWTEAEAVWEVVEASWSIYVYMRVNY